MQDTHARNCVLNRFKPRAADHRDGFPIGENESKQQQTVPVRTAKDIEGLRKACRLGREALDAAARIIKCAPLAPSPTPRSQCVVSRRRRQPAAYRSRPPRKGARPALHPPPCCSGQRLLMEAC